MARTGSRETFDDLAEPHERDVLSAEDVALALGPSLEIRHVTARDVAYVNEVEASGVRRRPSFEEGA